MRTFRLALACLALALVAGYAHAAVLPVTPATFATLQASASCGDTLALSAGGYGDVQIRKTCPAAQPLRITAADPLARPVFRSISAYASTGISLDKLDVALTPDAKTVSYSAALAIKASSDITVTAVQVTSGPAVNGIDPATAQAQDNTGNVRGYPAGYGVFLYQSQRVTLDGLDISQVDRGISMSGVQDVKILNSRIHDTRRTSILGGDLQRVTISRNHLSDVHPWAWGQTARQSDHGDMLALWTTPTMTVPSDGISVTGNLMEQGAGTPVLGFWMQGAQGGKAVGFTNTRIVGNVLLLGNLQGIMLDHLTGGVVNDNILLQTSGDPAHNFPSILIRAGVTQVKIARNLTAMVDDRSGAVGHDANVASDNVSSLNGVQPAGVLALAQRLVSVP